MTAPAQQAPPNNGTSAALSKLLSQLNIPTLLSIFVMNGWNLGATNQASQTYLDEVRKALRQINELHGAIDDFEKRQKDELANQEKLLNELHRWQQNFKNPES